jgi:hypothetical protein
VKYENSLRWTSCSYSVLDEQHYLDANWVWEELWRRYTCIHLIGINSMYAWAKRKIVCYEVHLWSFFKGAEGSTASLLKVAWAKNCLVWGASLKPLIQGRGRQNNLGFCYLGFCFGFCYILGELETDFFFLCLAWMISPSLASGAVTCYNHEYFVLPL